MAVEGKARKGWMIRMLVGGVAFFAFSAWCLYDGMVRYPAIEKDFQTFYERLTPTEHELLKSQMESALNKGTIEKTVDGTKYGMEISREEGSPQLLFKNLSKDKEYTVHRKEQEGEGPQAADENPYYVKGKTDIQTQFLMFGLCVLVGGVLIGRVLLVANKKFAADETGVSLGDKKIPYDRIREIDKRKWNRKSIAVVTYEEEGAGRKAFKIDDWIFEGGSELLKTVEEHTGTEVTIQEPKEPGSGSAGEGKRGE